MSSSRAKDFIIFLTTELLDHVHHVGSMFYKDLYQLVTHFVGATQRCLQGSCVDCLKTVNLIDLHPILLSIDFWFWTTNKLSLKFSTRRDTLDNWARTVNYSSSLCSGLLTAEHMINWAAMTSAEEGLGDVWRRSGIEAIAESTSYLAIRISEFPGRSKLDFGQREFSRVVAFMRLQFKFFFAATERFFVFRIKRFGMVCTSLEDPYCQAASPRWVSSHE